jgi:hypothetical protein
MSEEKGVAEASSSIDEPQLTSSPMAEEEGVAEASSSIDEPQLSSHELSAGLNEVQCKLAEKQKDHIMAENAYWPSLKHIDDEIATHKGIVADLTPMLERVQAAISGAFCITVSKYPLCVCVC